MAIILENKRFNANTFLMTVQFPEKKALGKCGQFYMVKASQTCDPLLNRPISIFDTDDINNTIKLLYVVVGRGTELMSQMKSGDPIDLYGPYGNGFPLKDADITLIGGGIGAAPLYLLAKEHKELYPNRHIRMHIGFRAEEDVIMYDEFKSLCDDSTLNIGGYVTDDVDFTEDRIYYTCGTMPMMAAVSKLAIENGKSLYLSLDNHMACGVGACLVCTCKTKDGTKKRACKDGPVFEASEVYDLEKGRFYE